MLIGKLGTSLLRDILSNGLLGKGIVRAGERIKKALISPKPYPLTNFEVLLQKDFEGLLQK